MYKRLIYTQLLFILVAGAAFGQINVRVFADQQPTSAVLTAIQGKYELDLYDGKPIPVAGNEPVLLALYDGKIAVKIKNEDSFMCDSLIVKGLTGNDRFSFRINGDTQIRQNYGGDLKCFSDLNTMVFINVCDIEQYVAGVVRAEGGPGKSIEYLKSQAILVRTFLYRHLERHIIDRYNLCDNTHCQAFKGLSDDSLVNMAARETRGQVVLTSDSTLIISAFHSNCGGETSTSEDVWLSGYSYLIKVTDPYCLNSPNSKWRKSISYPEWETYLGLSGFRPEGSAPQSYDFSQITRQKDYRIGYFSMPFTKIRDDLNLRSSFFSVIREGDSIAFKGRGYGHGVGLCQEGAMVMAAKGFKYSEIIGFYYSGVIIADIKNAKILKSDY